MPIDLARLDPDQRAAVTAPDGAVLVFAGAGSGKTRTLTARVAHLIDIGVEPPAIMAMTFTRKAAEEMKVRCRRLLAGGASQAGWNGLYGLRIGTFHSQMATLLRGLPPEVLARVGRSAKFSIWDEDDRANAVAQALHELELHLPEGISKKDVAARISAWKNDDLTLSEYPMAPGSRRRGEVIDSRAAVDFLAARAWPVYEETARRNDAFDFDDLLTVPVYLLGTDAELLRSVSSGIRHLLVDEFQDTNTIQMHLIELLGAYHHNIFVVGDDAQSIYRFRGARIENILSFESRFAGATRIVLNTNYRSTQPILDLANTVIAGSSQNLRKDLRSHRADPAARKPVLRRFDDESAEAAYVIEEIRAINARGVKLSDLAILIRVRAQTRPFEDAARKSGVPYRMLGGFAFWDRKEVKDLMAWLRLVLNPADEMAFVRAVERPRRGVGDVLQETILSNARVRGGNVVAAARAVADPAFGLGNTRSRAGLVAMCEIIGAAAGGVDTRAPRDLVRNILEDSGLREFYGAAGTPESVSAVENLFEVVNAASSYEDGQLREFVEASTIEAVATDSGEKDQMTISTLHGAKGLEWRGVYLCGFEDGLLPYARALNEDGGEDEERRLAYVGITRAKALLTLTAVSSRFLNGERLSQRVSRFLDRAGASYALADHTSPDGGAAARMAASGRTPFGAPRSGFGARPGGFAARPTAGLRPNRPGSSATRFPRHP